MTSWIKLKYKKPPDDCEILIFTKDNEMHVACYHVWPIPRFVVINPDIHTQSGIVKKDNVLYWQHFPSAPDINNEQS